MLPLDHVVGHACVLDLPALNCGGFCFHLIIMHPEMIIITIAHHAITNMLDNIEMPSDKRGNRLYFFPILSSLSSR